MSNLLFKRIHHTTATCLFTAGTLYYTFSHKPSRTQEKMLPSYTATFAVPMHCDACIDDISTALSEIDGIQETSFSLSSQLLTTKTTAPPSSIIDAIQSSGRSAILRGSGNANSAAVCILETPPLPHPSLEPAASPVRGLARLIELSERITLLDLTLTGLPEGSYVSSIRQTGDISKGKESMGGIFSGLEGDREGQLGKLKVDNTGKGVLMGEVDWRVWEMVGRGIMVQRVNEGDGLERERGNGEGVVEKWDDVVMGVVARSAGVWENEKVVCGCSGKTVWEEREEMVRKGIL